MIEILAVRWLGTKLLNVDFQRDYYNSESLSGGILRTTQSQYNICFPHELNIVLEVCEGLRTRLEYYTPLKKGFHTFKKFAAAHSVAKLFSTLFSSAPCGTAWPLHFKFASYAYGSGVGTVAAVAVLAATLFRS